MKGKKKAISAMVLIAVLLVCSSAVMGVGDLLEMFIPDETYPTVLKDMNVLTGIVENGVANATIIIDTDNADYVALANSINANISSLVPGVTLNIIDDDDFLASPDYTKNLIVIGHYADNKFTEYEVYKKKRQFVDINRPGTSKFVISNVRTGDGSTFTNTIVIAGQTLTEITDAVDVFNTELLPNATSGNNIIFDESTPGKRSNYWGNINVGAPDAAGSSTNLGEAGADAYKYWITGDERYAEVFMDIMYNYGAKAENQSYFYPTTTFSSTNAVGDNSGALDFNIRDLIPIWRNIERSPYFLDRPDESLYITKLLNYMMREYYKTSAVYGYTGSDYGPVYYAELDNYPIGNHELNAAYGLVVSGLYFSQDGYSFDESAYQSYASYNASYPEDYAVSWFEKGSDAFQVYVNTSYPNDDATGYFNSNPWMTREYAWYTNDVGNNADYFGSTGGMFNTGPFQGYADFLTLTITPSKINAGFGDVHALNGLDWNPYSFMVFAEVLLDGRYLWMRDFYNNPSLGSTDWGKTWHQFGLKDLSGLGVTMEEPTDLYGVTVAPLDEALWHMLDQFHDGRDTYGSTVMLSWPLFENHVPLSEATNKVFFKSGLDDRDQMMVLDAVAIPGHGHHDQLSIATFEDNNRLFLLDHVYYYHDRKYRTALSINKMDAASGEKEAEMQSSSVAGINDEADFNSTGFASLTVPQYGNFVEWGNESADGEWSTNMSRSVIWVKEGLFFIIDEVEANDAGNYNLTLTWKTMGDLRGEGSNILTVNQSNEYMVINTPNASFDFKTMSYEPDVWGYPYAENETIRLVSSEFIYNLDSMDLFSCCEDSCGDCSGASCGSYTNQLTCLFDQCGLGCAWDGNSCVDDACENGAQQPCSNQNGVCAGSNDTCTANTWPGCDSTTYSNWAASQGWTYEEGTETICNDGQDNDCDGLVDGDDTSDCPNTPPVISSLNITPQEPEDLDDLNCSFMITDNETVDLFVNYTWYRNGAVNASSQVDVTNGTYYSLLLDNTNTSYGDNWTCSILPYDGIDYGAPQNYSVLISASINCSDGTPIGACSGLNNLGTYGQPYKCENVSGVPTLELNCSDCGLIGPEECVACQCYYKYTHDGLNEGCRDKADIGTLFADPLESQEQVEYTGYNYGDVVGGSFTGGIHGNAFYPNGSGYIVFLFENVSYQGNSSYYYMSCDVGGVDFWVSPVNLSSPERSVFFDEGPDDNNRIRVYFENETVYYERAGGGDSILLSQDVSWNDDEWHHIHASWGESGTSLYVDDNMSVNHSTTGIGNFSQFFYVGADSSGNWPAEFIIDDIAIFSTQRSDFGLCEDNYTITNVCPELGDVYRMRFNFTTNNSYSVLSINDGARVLNVNMTIDSDSEKYGWAFDDRVFSLSYNNFTSTGEVIALIDQMVAGENVTFRMGKLCDETAENFSLTLYEYNSGTANEIGTYTNNLTDNCLDFEISVSADSLMANGPFATIPDTRYYEPMVWAHYYPWYDYNAEDWFQFANEDIYPKAYSVFGNYNTSDPAFITYQINQARDAGIDGFILAPTSYANTMILLEVAKNESFPVVPAIGGSDSQADLEYLTSSVSNYLENYYNVSEYMFYTVDDKPVVFWWATWWYDYDTIKEVMDNMTEQYGYDGIDISMSHGSILTSTPLEVFDGLNRYNFIFGLEDTEITNCANDAMTKTYHLLNGGDRKIYVATLLSGYNERVIATMQTWRDGLSQERCNGAIFNYTYDMAMQTRPDWLSITTWNEFPEHSYIEPEENEEIDFLSLVKYYSDNYKTTCYSLNGIVCADNLECIPGFLNASDSDRCCAVACTEPAGDPEPPGGGGSGGGGSGFGGGLLGSNTTNETNTTTSNYTSTQTGSNYTANMTANVTSLNETNQTNATVENPAYFEDDEQKENYYDWLARYVWIALAGIAAVLIVISGYKTFGSKTPHISLEEKYHINHVDMSRLKAFIDQTKQEGHTDKELEKALFDVGWKEDLVEEVLKKEKKELKEKKNLKKK